MVDAAVKAPSPGVNDATTAVTCVDRLGAVVVHLANRRIENRLRTSHGELRVVARGPTFESLVSAAPDEIRRNAAGNVSVLARLLSTLETVAGCTPDAQRRAVLRAHGSRILATAERTVPEEGDRAEVREVHGRLGRALDPDPG